MQNNNQSQNNNVNLLNSIYQNAKMVSENITQLLPKVNDQNFQSILMDQLSQYQGIANKANKMLTDMHSPPKECMVDKLTNKACLTFNTLTNTSTSHMAEMMITGNTMGVIDITKQLNKIKNCQEDICNLCTNLVEIEEQSVEDLKQFL